MTQTYINYKVFRYLVIGAFLLFQILTVLKLFDPFDYANLYAVICAMIVLDALVYWVRRRRAFYLLLAMWCLIDATVLLFAHQYAEHGLVVTRDFIDSQMYAKNASVSEDRILTGDSNSAIYFSVVTLTTLGYGDFRPTFESRQFAMAEALMGMILMGLLVALIIETRKDLTYFCRIAVQRCNQKSKKADNTSENIP